MFLCKLLSELRLAEMGTKTDDITTATAISYGTDDSSDLVDHSTAHPSMLNKVILLLAILLHVCYHIIIIQEILGLCRLPSWEPLSL